jgi:hypothetical protein
MSSLSLSLSLDMCDFNGSVYVSEQLNRQMINMVQDVAMRCVKECASKYNFDGEEAVRLLGLNMLRIERKAVKSCKGKICKVSMPKASFPLPYNGEFNESCCYALRQNNGLYTQCTGPRKGESEFCKHCLSTMQKTGSEIPEYGTIQERKSADIFDYVDPKGRKPTPYTKVMKKYKITQEQVLEEAGKLNIIINPQHFVVPEETKRGRPSSKKEPKEKGVKGRPKKSKKVIQIDGDDEDLFATLVANANEDLEEQDLDEENAEEDTILTSKSSTGVRKVITEGEKDAKKAAKEAEKAEKEAKRLAEKAEKEAKLAAEKAEKEAKRLAEKAEKAEKEAKLAAEKAEKEAKRLAEKAEKEAKLAAEKAEKEAKRLAASQKSSKKTSSSKSTPPEDEEEEEPEVLKKIEFEGKKYLKSKKSGIVYDYQMYVKTQELVLIGKWNPNTNKIVFEKAEDDSDEESEDEYDD